MVLSGWGFFHSKICPWDSFEFLQKPEVYYFFSLCEYAIIYLLILFLIDIWGIYNLGYHEWSCHGIFLCMSFVGYKQSFPTTREVHHNGGKIGKWKANFTFKYNVTNNKLNPDLDVEFYKHKTGGNVLTQVKEVSSDTVEECLRSSQSISWPWFCLGQKLWFSVGAAKTHQVHLLTRIS